MTHIDEIMRERLERDILELLQIFKGRICDVATAKALTNTVTAFVCLSELDSEKRKNVFSMFCTDCGDYIAHEPRGCFCTRDE